MAGTENPVGVGMGWDGEGEGGTIPTATLSPPECIHCHHQNDSALKKGSDESHFNNCGVKSKMVSTSHNL